MTEHGVFSVTLPLFSSDTTNQDVFAIVMSIGNQKFGIPSKYQTKSVFGISVSIFFGIFLVFLSAF